MSERISELDDNLFGPAMFDRILRTVTTAMSERARRDPHLRHFFEQPRLQDPAATASAQSLAAEYLDAANVLESVHLTRRQQEIARLVVGLAVVSDQKFTDRQFATMLSTTHETTLAVTSALAARRDHYAPRGLRFAYRLPLLKEVTVPDSRCYYEPAEALQWCLEEPGRSPIIDEATFEAAELLEVVANDSL